jgi:hypothetical protein
MTKARYNTNFDNRRSNRCPLSDSNDLEAHPGYNLHGSEYLESMPSLYDLYSDNGIFEITNKHFAPYDATKQAALKEHRLSLYSKQVSFLKPTCSIQVI